MLKKLQESFLWEAEKRIANPFIWSFIIAWIFWNWDFIYVFFFLDQQYVSLKYELGSTFFTKVEYLKANDLYNINDFVWNPLWSGLLVYIGIEWGTTLINIWVEWVKNKILKLETVTLNEYQKIKEKIVETNKTRREENSRYIEENLKLTESLDNMKDSIKEEASNIAKKDIEKKNNEIKTLQKDIDNRDKRYEQLLKEKEQLLKIQDDLSEKNYNLESIINEKNGEIELLKNKGKNNFSLLNDDFKKDYDNFKATKYFKEFEDLINDLGDSLWRYLSKYSVIQKKFFETRWIIELEENYDNYGNLEYYYVFTEKWNKFVEYYLDDSSKEFDIPF